MTDQEEFDSGLSQAKELVKTFFDPEDEELPSGGILMRREKDGSVLKEPSLMIIAIDGAAMHNSAAKDDLVRMFQRMTKDTDAAWCFLSARAWTVTVDKKIDMPRGSIAEDPRKREVKLLVFEHRNLGRKVYIAPITKQDGKDVLGEFEESQEGDSRFKLFDRKSN